MIYLQLFFSYMQIGLFSIGGGYAMVPYISDVVTRHGWLTLQELADVIALAEMTPGPFAINCSTFVGMRVAGLPGAFIATLGVALPCFVLSVIVARFFYNFREKKAVRGILSGIRPMVVGLIAAAVISIGSATFWYNDSIDLIAVLLALLSLILLFKTKIHPILMIFGGALAGILVYQILPAAFGG